MKLIILILAMLVLSLGGCGNSLLVVPGNGNGSDDFLEGHVSRVINLIFPSAYAAPMAPTAYDVTTSFTDQLNGVTDAESAFLGIMSVFLNDQINGAEYEIYNMAFSNKAEYEKYGFVITKCIGSENQIIGIFGSALDKNGNFKSRIPSELKNRCPLYTVEAFYQENADSSLINRQAVVATSDGAIEVNAETSILTSHFKNNFQTQLTNDGVNSNQISTDVIKSIIANSRVQTQATLTFLGVTAERFNAIANLFMTLIPAMPDAVAIAQELKTDRICAQAFVNTYLADVGESHNYVSIEANAKALINQARNEGLTELKFNYFANVEDSTPFMAEVDTKFQSPFIAYINGYLAQRGDPQQATHPLFGTPLFEADGTTPIMGEGQLLNTSICPNNNQLASVAEASTVEALP